MLLKVEERRYIHSQLPRVKHPILGTLKQGVCKVGLIRGSPITLCYVRGYTKKDIFEFLGLDYTLPEDRGMFDSASEPFVSHE